MQEIDKEDGDRIILSISSLFLRANN